MKKLSLFAFCVLCVLTISSQNISVSGNSEVVIDEKFLVFQEKEIELTIQQARQELRANNFLPVNANSFNPLIDAYWLSFTVYNPNNFDQEVVLDFNNWSYVKLVEFNDSSQLIHHTGHLYPYQKRDFPIANKNYVRLFVQQGDSTEVLVRLQKAYNNEKIPTNLEFRLADRAYVDNANDIVGKGIFAFLAVFMVTLLYNLFIYISTRIKSYLYYLFVILIAMYHTAYNSGYIIQIFGGVEKFPVGLTYFERISSNLLGIFVILFVQAFLNLKIRYPKWDRVMRMFIYAYVLFGILLYIHEPIATILSAITGFGSITLIISVAIKSVRDKYPSALFFLAGYSMFLLSIVLLISVVLGIIPYNIYIIEFALPIGSTIEILLFSFALANMINVLRRENEIKQARIIFQLEENKQLQSKVNRELEEKVVERTLEIQKQKEIIEQEKDKSDQLLLNILPEATANELKTKGFSTPKQHEEVSVMFTDFVGFSKISKHISAAKLVQELDYCFKSFDEIIAKYDLEKIKTIGDSYMAICGAPKWNKNHMVNTVLVAKEFYEFIDEWNKEKAKKGEYIWEMRLGIHAGPLVAGVVGKRKFSYDIWGDTVNTASRMESGGIPGKINISGFVYEKIKDQFACEYRGIIKDKNGFEIQMYVLDPKG